MSTELAREFFINPAAWNDALRLSGRVICRSADPSDDIGPLVQEAGLNIEWSPTRLKGLHFCFAFRPVARGAISRLRRKCAYLYPEILDQSAPQVVEPSPIPAVAGQQLHLRYLNTDSAWVTTKGSGVNVAVIDASFDLGLWNLSDRFSFGRFRDDTNVRWIDTSDQATFPRSSNDHGSTCAALAVGAEASGWGAGVAPCARFIPIAIGADVSATKIAESLLWLLEPGVISSPLVISCSVTPVEDVNGHVSIPPVLKETLDALEVEGIPLAWAVSNNEFANVANDGPASHAAVVSVGCLNTNLKTAGATPPAIYAVVAGSEVRLSNDQRSSWDCLENYSSWAPPVAAGVAALALSKNNSLRARDLYALMKLHSSTDGNVCWLNANAVLEHV